MSLLAIIQEYLTRYGMSTYLIFGNLVVASIMNIFIINFGIIPAIYSLNHINPEVYSIIYCKLRLYLLHSTLMISRSMIVLACIDQFAICSSTKRIHPFCQPKVAIYLIILISFIWPIIASHILVLLTIKSGQCSAYGKYSLIYSIYSFIVAGFLPLTLMITFGFLTIRNLRSIHSRIRTNIIRISHMYKKDYYLSVMLMCEAIGYFISTISYLIQTLYLTITRDILKSSFHIQIESFITFLFISIFYIYISTSRAYRHQCRRFIICCWMKITKSTIDQSVSEYRRSISRRQQTTTV